MVRLWRQFDDNARTTLGAGLEAWKSVFAHLKDARFWGPEDRLANELREAWQFRIDHGAEVMRFEVEAWHHKSPDKNAAASGDIRRLVQELGGAVLDERQISEIAYHGFLVEMPAAGVNQLLNNNAPLLLSDRVMFFRAQGQAIKSIELANELEPVDELAFPAADGAPVVALLDGLPLTNHPLLQGRLDVDDPDGWAGDYAAAERRHGTAMASLIALGDLSQREAPLPRRIHVRPIMKPDGPAGSRFECTPSDRLLIDLVHVAVRRMFEGIDGQAATAPSVRVINLSVGDSHRLFSGELSAWARLLDWLQHKYRVLFIVSAGNQLDGNLLLETPAGTLEAMALQHRSALATRAVCGDDMHRRIFSPAESINALTIGAGHIDSSPLVAVPGRFLLFDEGGLAPYSCIGPGFRRAIKPDILLPGGRVLFREAVQSPAGHTKLQVVNTGRAPGHCVAVMPTAQGNTIYTNGTSNAAALGSRWADRAYSVLEGLRAGSPALSPKFDAVLIKALLAHGASIEHLQDQVLAARPDVRDWYAQRRLMSRYGGLGVADVERALVCTEQRATLLGVGTLKNNKALEFRVPLPPSLHATVVKRRVTTTLAWMSPVNPRHSKYRVARLWVDLPDEPLRGDRVQGEWRQLRQGTLHHEVFEQSRAVPILDGAFLSVRVNCVAEAGRIDEPVEFALCVSLEIGEGVDLPIYQEIRERVAPRVAVQAAG